MGRIRKAGWLQEMLDENRKRVLNGPRWKIELLYNQTRQELGDDNPSTKGMLALLTEWDEHNRKDETAVDFVIDYEVVKPDRT